MSFYLHGMRTADILQLKWEQVKVGRVEYEAGKTGKFRSKKVIPRALEILAQYDKNGIQPSEYIFPFLKGKNKAKFPEDDWLKVISSSNALINGHLATIAKKIEVRNISMHVARHSFADIAKKKTVMSSLFLMLLITALYPLRKTISTLLQRLKMMIW